MQRQDVGFVTKLTESSWVGHRTGHHDATFHASTFADCKRMVGAGVNGDLQEEWADAEWPTSITLYRLVP
jgi:hypothetical protein